LIKTLGSVAMPAYSHLLDEERDQIAVMRAAGRSICAIARALQRAKSTVSRELRRNGLSSGRYSPLHAAGAYQLRRRREAILEKDQKLRTFVCDRLAEGWTPEQISGWLKAGNERRLRAVGCETIYAFIYRAYQKAEQLWRYHAGVRADRGPHEIRSKIGSPSMNGLRLSTPEPRPAIGRTISSSASAHGRCSFSMSANPV
jgi:IS30 family transposase